MATTISGWKAVTYDKQGISGKMAHFKETFTFGTGATDVLGTEFGIGTSGPAPPPGVDFTVMFIQNNTMSAAGDMVLRGKQKAGGTFALLKDDLVAYGASSAGGDATAAVYETAPGKSITGGQMPVYQFLLDGDGAHSATTGTDKTAEIHITWVLP